MRTNANIRRIGAALAGLAVVATPVALAAPKLDDATTANVEDERAGKTELSTAKRGPTRETEERFHPVLIGSPDYGESGAEFGAARSGHVHEGQDVFAPSGTPLVAVADGEVVEAGTDGGRGNYVSIHDAEADRTYNYFHLVEPATVKQGESVSAGQRVGAVGCTGSCWGDHLHFEVHEGRDPYGRAVDPMPLLQKLPQAR